jgi:cobalt-zinc-cadmium efflux system outer membrane protein
MEEQYKAGNIARKDLLRVQALEMSLSQEVAENNKSLEDAEAALKTLLQADSKTYIKPIGDNVTIPVLPNIGTDGLIELAKQNNANYKLQQMQVQQQQQNLALQKALAVPDVSFGPNFDQSGGYAPNYYGLGISLPLPILNRNQGNIKAARWQVKQSEATAAQAEEELKNNVTSAYNKFNLSLQLASGKQQDFYKNYGELFGNVMESYRQRQLSLLEFIDFFDTYKETRQRQLQWQLDLQLAKEELNYITGTDIIK